MRNQLRVGKSPESRDFNGLREAKACFPVYFLRHNQRGFSIIQLMVAFALLGVFSVFMMKSVENVQKSQKFSELKNDEIMFVNLIGDYLKNPIACSNALSGLKLNQDIFELPFLVESVNNPMKDGIIPGTKLRIKEMKISEVGSHLGNGVFPIVLRISLTREGSSYNMAGTTINKDFKVLVEMCEPQMHPVTNVLEYGLAMNWCESEANSISAEYSSYEPKTYSGTYLEHFICNLCKSDKAISSCSNALD